MSTKTAGFRLTDNTFEAVCAAVEEVLSDAMVRQNEQPLSEAAVNLIDSQTRSWLIEFLEHQPDGCTSANILAVTGCLLGEFRLSWTAAVMDKLAARLRNLLGS